MAIETTTPRGARTCSARAEGLFPGGVNSPVRAFRSVGRPPVILERGDGAYVSDADGRRYLDLHRRLGAAILGHGHPAVTAAVIGAAAQRPGSRHDQPARDRAR